MAPTDADSLGLRHALVEYLQREGRLHSPRVAQAMRDVPRELFVPGVPLDEVYRAADAIVTKRIDGICVSSASAPEVVALMLEQLDPKPGERLLEIGAGTGYNAALLQHLVGPSGQVISLDIDEDLVLSAREHLHSAGYPRVQVIQADGALGVPTLEPFKRIMLTVASNDIAPAWRDQLAPDGRLVLPLGLAGPQRSVAFTVAEDHLVSDSVRNCSFIPLRGLLTADAVRHVLDPEESLILTSALEPLSLPEATIATMLKGALQPTFSGVVSVLDELRPGFHLWLVSHQPGVAIVWGGPGLPDLFGLSERLGRGTICVLDESSLALLAWADEAQAQRGSEVVVLAPASSAGTALASRVAGLIRRWAAEGRPGDEALTIRAYPHGTPARPRSQVATLEQRWTRFELEWTTSR